MWQGGSKKGVWLGRLAFLTFISQLANLSRRIWLVRGKQRAAGLHRPAIARASGSLPAAAAGHRLKHHVWSRVLNKRHKMARKLLGIGGFAARIWKVGVPFTLSGGGLAISVTPSPPQGPASRPVKQETSICAR